MCVANWQASKQVYLLSIAFCIITSCSSPSGTIPRSNLLGVVQKVSFPHLAHPDDLFLELEQADLDLDRRRQAAHQLIQEGGSKTIDRLITKLAPDSHPSTRQLILQAIATTRNPPSPAFARPLMTLLDQTDDARSDDLAPALGQFRDPKLIRSLIRLAQDPWTNIQRRRTAIFALGYHHSKAIADVLFNLVSAERPLPVRTAAARALAMLTFTEQGGLNHWQPWWDQHQKLSDDTWYESILRNASTSRSRLIKRSGQIEDRLSELQQQLYRTMAQGDRPAYLASMLDDPLETIRRLAIDLCVQRLIDNQPINTELRLSLLARLNDPIAHIRQGAVRLLRDLSHEQAADVVAQRLELHNESDPNVLQAYLHLMARMPRAAVVDPALEWLTNEFLGTAAASALAAAAKQELLSANQTVKAATMVRSLLHDDQIPHSEFVELLGQVGGDIDWQRIAYWMDSNDEGIKLTAAKVWADSRQPLKILLEHAGDPVIQQIVIAAARRRGFLPESLQTLVAHKPEQDQAIQAWQLAVVAVALRVEPNVVLQANNALALRNESLDLRQRLLSSAINRLAAGPIRAQSGKTHSASESNASAWIELLLARSDVRLIAGNPPQALADLERLTSLTAAMDPDQLDRYYLGTLQAQLAGDNLDQAVAWIQQILQDQPTHKVDPVKMTRILEMFLTAARHGTGPDSIRLDHANQIRLMLSQIRQILEPYIPEQALHQIIELQVKYGPEPSKETGGETPTAQIGQPTNEIAKPIEPVEQTDDTP